MTGHLSDCSLNQLERIIDFFILYKTEKAWQLPQWLSLSLREDGSWCSSEIAKWCGFIVHFYSSRREENWESMSFYKSHLVLVTTSIPSELWAVRQCTSDLANAQTKKIQSKNGEWLHFGFIFHVKYFCPKRRSFTDIKAYCNTSSFYYNTHFLENYSNMQEQ